MIGTRKAIMNNIIPIFVVLLLAKLMLFRSLVLSDFSWKGILADVAAISLLLALPTLICGKHKLTKLIQIILMVLISVIWFAASVYFSYYGTIPTFHTLSNMNQVGQIRQSVLASIDRNMYFYFVDFIIIALLALVLPRKKERPSIYWQSKPQRSKVRLVALVVTIISGLVTIYSLYDSKNIENNHALAKRLGVLTFQVAVAFQEETKDETQPLTEQEHEQLVQDISDQLGLAIINNEAIFHGVASGKNLIVIQAEAMQNFIINLEVNGQVITPNLNALLGESFYFSQIYQQVAEGNTSDAEYIFNTGAYPSASGATSQQLNGKIVNSLPRVLQSAGYDSYTFHVNDVSFWSRNQMYPALGFTQYFDKPYYVNDEFNYYGASDEQLFSFAIDKMQEKVNQGQAFYAHMITVSSHHPFVIPDQYQTLNLPDNLINTQLGNYLQAMHYVDEQIGQFIDELKQTGLFTESLIVLYGDHFGLQPNDNDPTWVSEQLAIPYHHTISRMNIPLIVTVPGMEGTIIDQVGGQVDMLPTVLNLLGIIPSSDELLMFGEDLLNTQSNTFGSRYYLPTGSYFNDDVLFVPGAGFEDGEAISLTTHESVPLTKDMEQDYRYILEVLRLSDIYTAHYLLQKEKILKKN